MNQPYQPYVELCDPGNIQRFWVLDKKDGKELARGAITWDDPKGPFVYFNTGVRRMDDPMDFYKGYNAELICTEDDDTDADLAGELLKAYFEWTALKKERAEKEDCVRLADDIEHVAKAIQKNADSAIADSVARVPFNINTECLIKFAGEVRNLDSAKKIAGELEGLADDLHDCAYALGVHKDPEVSPNVEEQKLRKLAERIK